MPPANVPNRTYAAAHFALELDGKDGVGLFRSVEGGGVRTDVMTYSINGGKQYERWRQLGKPKFEDIKLQVGMAMSGAFINWIRDFIAGNAARKNGAIVAADFYYNERARRSLSTHFESGCTGMRTTALPSGTSDAATASTVPMISWSGDSANALAPSNRMPTFTPRSRAARPDAPPPPRAPRR